MTVSQEIEESSRMSETVGEIDYIGGHARAYPERRFHRKLVRSSTHPLEQFDRIASRRWLHVHFGWSSCAKGTQDALQVDLGERMTAQVIGKHPGKKQRKVTQPAEH